MSYTPPTMEELICSVENMVNYHTDLVKVSIFNDFTEDQEDLSHKYNYFNDFEDRDHLFRVIDEAKKDIQYYRKLIIHLQQEK